MFSVRADNVDGLTVGTLDGKLEVLDAGKFDAEEVGIFTDVFVGFVLVGGDVRLAKIPGGNRCENELSVGLTNGDKEGWMVGSELDVIVGFEVKREGPSDGSADEAAVGVEGNKFEPSGGTGEGPSDGTIEGPSDGTSEGPSDGMTEGPSDGMTEGPSDGSRDVPAVGISLGF
mmetsp:Transcript_14899/g.30492  ORF Transcript_14899/g.30492 Transcript_14899/m.30492 type:complete len:173 (+) Transcript_14899:968-1486(+)